MGFIMKIYNLIFWFVLSIAFSGCVGVFEVSHNRPRMNEYDVVELADSYSRVSFPDFKPEYYSRIVSYDDKRKIWWIRYGRHESRRVGDHFTVGVNDRTKEITLIGGA